LAHGLADNLLTITALAAVCPVMIAPAMDGGMFDAPATQANLDLLKDRGVYVAGPAEGHLASGLTGTGRMLEAAELLGHIRILLGRKGRLAGKKVLITAGGTREALDPVRMITNRSSGKQGYALAQAAIDLGAETTLVSTTTSLTAPVGARLIPVESALQMRDAVMAELPGADALVMSAAVADFRPKDIAADKMKKRDGLPRIELEATPDILRTVTASPVRPRVVAGFAAESRDLLENANEKLKAKNLDMIAANDISAEGAGFAGETNRITLLFANGQREELPLMDKSEAAAIIMEHIAALMEG
jgi:phosphopantothenoylcysteine decarboxylase/phosphopantothenate--cysteine ligase